ncbi:MAG: radical SAM protein, partial [Promethearchaeota archaeon]
MTYKPTTIHLLQYSEDGCVANCKFCPQAKDSRMNKDCLSRVVWPRFEWKDVKEKLFFNYEKGSYQRICLQTVLYKSFVEDMMEILTDMLREIDIPVSVAIVPVNKNILKRLKEIGVQRVGIAFDAATPRIFTDIKGKNAGGPFTWERHEQALKDAVSIFGANQISTHLIVGIGEKEIDDIDFIQAMRDLGVNVDLFAFMPVRGTQLQEFPQPNVDACRRIQRARYII